MNRSQISLLLPLCLSGIYIAAQTPAKELPLVSAGAGLTLFSGDVGKSSKTGGLFRTAYRFGIEQRFGNYIGAEVFANYGMLSKSERSISLNRNFESPVLFAGANAVFYFNNDLIMKRNSLFVPYISAGFGWMSFDPHGDLKDANDSIYHYWSNGSINSAAENSPNAANSILLQRDYTYETKLTDSASNYSRSTFGIPLGIGMRFQFSPHLGATIQANYFLTFSDYIDNTKDGGNDSWYWYGCSLYYKFGKRPDRSSEAETRAMMNEDYDGDGVADGSDECQGTPAGVKVNRNGCPLDDDGDGVPDYLDKEPNTKKGITVDVNGVGLDYTKIEEEAKRDSINEAQKTNFANNPSVETLKQGDADIQKKSGPDCIPAEFRAADFNTDCIISADEINKVIDNFFDGAGNTWTADGINRLIDYFFDQ